MAFTLPPRVPLAQLPTPFYRLERLSREWGADLWIKRDDQTGGPLTGNKVRKLEYHFAKAIEGGAKAVITCGGVQSNHCRATAIAARQLGLVPHLLLRTTDGRKPAEIDGNTLLDVLVGAEITWVNPDQYRNARQETMAKLAERYASDGLPAYVIPEGASDARGALGYVAAVAELKTQAQEQRVRIDYVAHACGSGGTTAGLTIGNRVHEAGLFPVAFAVCDDESYFKDAVLAIVNEFVRNFPGAPEMGDPRLRILDQYKGVGYAQSTQEELDFLRRVAELEGIVLDPVYSGKAMLGLYQELKNGKTFRRGSSICFLHTGGVFGLFPKRLEFGF